MRQSGWRRSPHWLLAPAVMLVLPLLVALVGVYIYGRHRWSNAHMGVVVAILVGFLTSFATIVSPFVAAWLDAIVNVDEHVEYSVREVYHKRRGVRSKVSRIFSFLVIGAGVSIAILALASRNKGSPPPAKPPTVLPAAGLPKWSQVQENYRHQRAVALPVSFIESTSVFRCREAPDTVLGYDGVHPVFRDAAWVSIGNGGTGQGLIFTLSHPSWITEIDLWNGYAAHRDNGYATTLAVWLDGGQHRVQNDDRFGQTRVLLTPPALSRVVALQAEQYGGGYHSVAFNGVRLVGYVATPDDQRRASALPGSAQSALNSYVDPARPACAEKQAAIVK